MDNSVRAILVDSKEDVAVELTKYKDIRYLVAAFPVEEAMIYEQEDKK